MTMRERIINGKLLADECEGLPAERTAAKKKMKSFNESSPENPAARIEMLKEMLGKSENVWIEPPFYFCHGTHIYIGEGSYINFKEKALCLVQPLRLQQWDTQSAPI